MFLQGRKNNLPDSQSMSLMKFGGNRNLRELLDVYHIDRKKVDKTIIYNSRLLDFYDSD